jgi:hypothetical protein
LNDRQIVPPVVNRCCALPFVGAGKNAAMLAHDLPLGDDFRTLLAAISVSAQHTSMRECWANTATARCCTGRAQRPATYAR